MEKMKLQLLKVTGEAVDLIEDSVVNIIEFFCKAYSVNENVHIPKVDTVQIPNQLQFIFYATDTQLLTIKQTVKDLYDVEV